MKELSSHSQVLQMETFFHGLVARIPLFGKQSSYFSQGFDMVAEHKFNEENRVIRVML
jgi:hypothetical protein